MEKIQMGRSISNTAKLRMAGYVVTIVVHSLNGLVMESGFYGGAMSDPGVRSYYEFRTRFITCWTFVAQIIYASIGLYCDVKDHEGKKDSNTLKNLKWFRDIVFPGIIVPYSFMVPTVFWTLYIYDKNLIMPAFMKMVVSSFSNHLVHTAIAFVVLWEMAFHPRRRLPHYQNIGAMITYTSIYLGVLIFSYYEKGMWPYPILTYLQGTVYIRLFIAFIIGLLPLYYWLQWYIVRFLERLNISKIE